MYKQILFVKITIRKFNEQEAEFYNNNKAPDLWYIKLFLIVIFNRVKFSF